MKMADLEAGWLAGGLSSSLESCRYLPRAAGTVSCLVDSGTLPPPPPPPPPPPVSKEVECAWDFVSAETHLGNILRQCVGVRSKEGGRKGKRKEERAGERNKSHALLFL